MEFSAAEQLTDALLRDVWAGRERADVGLPPSLLAIEAGDLLTLPGIGQAELLLAERIEDAESRSLALRRIDGRGPPVARGPVREPPDPVVPFGKHVVPERLVEQLQTVVFGARFGLILGRSLRTAGVDDGGHGDSQRFRDLSPA